ncbi:MAG: acyl-CoA thioesterase [Deltaproteobacteria bacterium]|nr:MAG: acyl-CoA thioesterase [Deltaproteobacteria bacterium]
MRWVETTTTVRFNEVDQWGITWYGHYFAWFELARMKVLEKFALLPEQFSALGFIAPVVSAQCEFKKPARTNDIITIQTHLLKPQTASLTFQFEILLQHDGSLLAKGETVQVLQKLDGTVIYKLAGTLKERVDSMVQYFWPD